MTAEQQSLLDKTTFDQQIEALEAARKSGFNVDPLALLEAVVNESSKPVSTEQVLSEMDLFWR